MPSNLDKYRAGLKDLIRSGRLMQFDLQLEREKGKQLPADLAKVEEAARGSLRKGYQKWYTEALTVVRQLTSARADEFEAAYRADPRRRQIDVVTYKIEDWLLGLRIGPLSSPLFDHDGVAWSRLEVQVGILEAAEARLDSVVHDMRGLLQSDLLDGELETARELAKHGFLRPAGVVAGVVLESHLGHIAESHGLRLRKKAPTISDYNDLLKEQEVVEVPVWRKIQQLGDLRNLCGHDRKREPTGDEVDELIRGVADITKTVF